MTHGQHALVAASTMVGTLMVSRIVTPSLLTRQHDGALPSSNYYKPQPRSKDDLNRRII